MPSLYQVPADAAHRGSGRRSGCRKLKLDVPAADLTEWKQVVARIATRSKTCTIALVGKYVKLHDAYLSVMESLYHAGFENDSQVEIRWVESRGPDRPGRLQGSLCGCGRHHRARRLWRPRH